MTMDFEAIRSDFPMLKALNRGKPLVYLDSAASAQKPNAVLDAMQRFYEHDYANIHRGIYELSARATDRFENVRNTVKQFINAKHTDEIIFVRGTTDAINLVANTLSRCYLKAGDEIILSEMEHHSNIVPWVLLRDELGITIRVIPVKDDGSLDIDAYQALFNERTKLVAVSHVSNALGVINPVSELAAMARKHHVPILLDGAQAVPHVPVDVTNMDCDFYAFSSHKLYGPTGVGVLYAKREWLNRMPPYQGGGDMIETVSFDNVTYAKPPHKFEAGTPDIVGVIGLGAAMDYINQIGIASIAEHEQQLLHYANASLRAIEGLTIIGTAAPKVGVISFVMNDIHPHDVGTVLDDEGVAVRAGHHCAMPLMHRFNVPATVRVSFGVYNNEADVDALVQALLRTKRLFT